MGTNLVPARAEKRFDVGDQVVACLHYRGRGGHSGAPIEIRETHVLRLREGKVIEVREYREKADALEAMAAGVAPP